jgi:hypothetical protein
MVKSNKDLKRRKAIISEFNYWQGYKNMPNNIKQLVEDIFRKLSKESKEEIKKIWR